MYNYCAYNNSLERYFICSCHRSLDTVQFSSSAIEGVRSVRNTRAGTFSFIDVSARHCLRQMAAGASYLSETFKKGIKFLWQETLFDCVFVLRLDAIVMFLPDRFFGGSLLGDWKITASIMSSSHRSLIYSPSETPYTYASPTRLKNSCFSTDDMS